MERQKSIRVNLVVESVEVEYVHFGAVMRITETYLRLQKKKQCKFSELELK